MVGISITKMSSKGQVVIPLEMRNKFKEGDKIVVLENDGQIILKKADKVTEQLAEDLKFAKRTEEAYKRIGAGEFIKMDANNFIKEMEKW